jgi:hypothetical protein
MENVQRQTLVRLSERLGTIFEHIVTGLGCHARSIGIHCHGIDSNRNNIIFMNNRDIIKSVTWFSILDFRLRLVSCSLMER